MANIDNLNALKSGIYSRHVLLPWEDPEQLTALYNELLRTYNPTSFTQEAVVIDIVKDEWRKRRVEISEMLASHKGAVTPELIEAARGGIVTLAAYIENNRASQTTGATTSKPKSISGEVVEQAYDPTRLARILKNESMLDNRIRKNMAKLEALKHYEKNYGKKSVQNLPLVQSPPTHPDTVVSEPWNPLNLFR